MINCGKFVDIVVKQFYDKFFKRADAYNKLMLDSAFYEEFIYYGYRLIAQTDTLIWSEDREIEKFMDSGYDY